MINGRKLKDKGNPWPGGGTGEINIIKYIIAAWMVRQDWLSYKIRESKNRT